MHVQLAASRTLCVQTDRHSTCGLESIGQTASVSTLAIATSLLVGDEWNAEVPCGLGSFSRTGSLWGWANFRCGTCARARVCVGTECSHGGAGGTNGSRCGGAVYRRKHGTGLATRRASRAARHTSCGVVKNNEKMRKQSSGPRMVPTVHGWQ